MLNDDLVKFEPKTCGWKVNGPLDFTQIIQDVCENNLLCDIWSITSGYLVLKSSLFKAVLQTLSDGGNPKSLERASVRQVSVVF